jgi:hypothetical protein
VAQSGRRSEVDVERLQITLSADAAGLLDRIVKIGRLGRNRNDVAARVVSDWLYEQARRMLVEDAELKKALKQFDGTAEGKKEDAQ